MGVIKITVIGGRKPGFKIETKNANIYDQCIIIAQLDLAKMAVLGEISKQIVKDNKDENN